MRVPVLYRYVTPSFPVDWEWPTRLIGGTLCLLHVQLNSPWHHAHLEAVSGPLNMMVMALQPDSNVYGIGYNPPAQDSGPQVASFALSDPYSDTVYTWSFVVLADSSRLLAFAPGAAQLPMYATEGRAVSWELVVAPPSGTPPLHYRAEMAGTGEVLRDTVCSTHDPVAVSWIPGAGHVGRQLLRMVVSDSLGDADTLLRELEVLPRNQYPCGLSYTMSAGTDTAANGAIDMLGATEPCTLWFAIHDLDHPLTEQYTAFITRGSVTTVETLDTSRVFQLRIEPSPQRWGTDTVDVVVLDATGTSASAQVRIWYGIPLPTVSGGARLEVYGRAVPEQMALVSQGDSLFVNSWQGSPSLLDFSGNTFGGTPPVLDSVSQPHAVMFDRAQSSNLIAEMSRNVWQWADSAFTLVVVARPDVVMSTGKQCLVALCDSDAGYVGMGLADGFVGAFGTDTTAAGTVAVSAGQWHVFVYSSVFGRQGQLLTVDTWLDGAYGQACQVTETLTGYHTMLGATLRSAASNGWTGAVGDVLMYRGRLTDQDRRQVEAYLASRYAITLQ